MDKRSTPTKHQNDQILVGVLRLSTLPLCRHYLCLVQYANPALNQAIATHCTSDPPHAAQPSLT